MIITSGQPPPKKQPALCMKKRCQQDQDEGLQVTQKEGEGKGTLPHRGEVNTRLGKGVQGFPNQEVYMPVTLGPPPPERKHTHPTGRGRQQDEDEDL